MHCPLALISLALWHYLASQLKSPGRETRATAGTHYVKLKEVTQARRTVDAHQDPILDSGAEAHGQAVRTCAGSVIGRPGINDEASALAKDVGSASCKSKKKTHEGRTSHSGDDTHNKLSGTLCPMHLTLICCPNSLMVSFTPI